jgi:hypothetical protein
MDKYLEHYHLLGLRRGDSWERLRKAYKSQMRQWHPDRFGQNDSARLQAEEMTKEINHAYQELVDFYELHGKLPLDAAPTPDPPRHSESTSSDHTIHQQWTPPTRPHPDGDGLRRGLMIGLMLGLVVGYVIWNSNWSKPEKETFGPPVAAGTRALPEEPAQMVEHRSFDVGSTLGEVYTAQGVPNRVEGDVWHYGEARVFFHNGRVVYWIDTDQHILHASAAGSQPATATAEPVFGPGSTRDEVRSVQGIPLHESENVWDYGLSRVYFDRNGRVSHWKESPLNPLHVKH